VVDIPSASDSRAHAQSLENEKNAKELAAAVSAIKLAVQDRKLSVSVATMSPTVRSALEAKGYKIRDCRDPRPGESCSVIEW
jgi:hypothetical protein